MNLSYSLSTRNIVPPGGFCAVKKNGSIASSSSYEVLVKCLVPEYPGEDYQQLKKRVDTATCESLVKRKAWSFLDIHVPSLAKQGDVTLIPNNMLLAAPHCYNPGLFEWRGELVMCYRRHLENQFSEIGIAMLDRDTLLPSTKFKQFTLQIPKDFDNEDHEDARIFWFGGDIFLSYTVWRRATLNGRWLYMPRIDVAAFDEEWNFKYKFTPDYGGNREIAQKNWTFFVHNAELRFCYDFNPHTVCNLKENNTAEAVATKGITWDYGTIRGSTPPQRISDTEYLSFFHSRKTDPGPPGKNRYYAGAYCFQAKEPFHITRYTETPVFAGSEKDELWDHSLACVFPCGLVIDGETALVSMGSNDMQCAIARVNIPKLLESMTSL